VTLTVQELCEGALLRVAPASALVKRNGDVMFLHGRTGMYLEPAPGEAGVLNILTMAREGLRSDLSVALLQAAAGHEAVSRVGVRVKTNGDFTGVDLAVHPVSGAEAGELFLVTLAGARERAEERRPPGSLSEETAARIALLEHELVAREVALRSTTQELGTRNEELSSSVEEMQSMNEELQSANEELTTSKEESQSMNEELQTLNGELQSKLDDLALAQNDMQNLLNSTEIATLFLDSALNVRRYTEQITRIVHLRESDIGRPLSDLATTLVYPELADDARETLRTLNFVEKEVRTQDGRWFQARIKPYRTLANQIQGVVITLIDITAAKELESRLRAG
jgi:two-component system CheB/CheR fusion protein